MLTAGYSSSRHHRASNNHHPVTIAAPLLANGCYAVVLGLYLRANNKKATHTAKVNRRNGMKWGEWVNEGIQKGCDIPSYPLDIIVQCWIVVAIPSRFKIIIIIAVILVVLCRFKKRDSVSQIHTRIFYTTIINSGGDRDRTNSYPARRAHTTRFVVSCVGSRPSVSQRSRALSTK